MPKLHVTTPDGQLTSFDADAGQTLMEAIVAKDLEGLEAICGGAMSCATCHVIFEGASLDQVGPAPDGELAMLEMSDECTPASRLSCQITLDDKHDGLRLRIPDEG